MHVRFFPVASSKELSSFSWQNESMYKFDKNRTRNGTQVYSQLHVYLKYIDAHARLLLPVILAVELLRFQMCDLRSKFAIGQKLQLLS